MNRRSVERVKETQIFNPLMPGGNKKVTYT